MRPCIACLRAAAQWSPWKKTVEGKPLPKPTLCKRYSNSAAPECSHCLATGQTCVPIPRIYQGVYIKLYSALVKVSEDPNLFPEDRTYHHRCKIACRVLDLAAPSKPVFKRTVAIEGLKTLIDISNSLRVIAKVQIGIAQNLQRSAKEPSDEQESKSAETPKLPRRGGSVHLPLALSNAEEVDIEDDIDWEVGFPAHENDYMESSPEEE